MKDIIIQELKSILQSNQCFNKMIEVNNQIKIIKSKYMGSSTIETREMINIYDILNQNKEYLEIIPTEDGIILKFK